MIDTHAHIDGEEFAEDRDDVIDRARRIGVEAVFVPAVGLSSIETVLATCARYPGYAYPMAGLHPEEVTADWQNDLATIRESLGSGTTGVGPYIAIGEVGLDYYWSRQYEREQREVFEEQVRWSVETRLPLMIHCRKAQNDMVRILRRYEPDLPGGVFHCFTGNAHEARELLSFHGFALGIGGVLTFKKSNLPDTLAQAVPLDRIVLETDSPYMAPVPMRGQRNEPSFVSHVLCRLAQCYGVSADEVDRITTETALSIFKLKVERQD